MASLPDVPGAIAAPVSGGLVLAIGALWGKVKVGSRDCDERIERALAPMRRRIEELEARCDRLVAKLGGD